MNKQEYLGALEYALAQMPPEEREKHLAYYDELICDMCEDGMSEEEATSRLGDPNAVAQELLAALPLATLVKTRIRSGGSLSPLVIALLVLGFPLWFPLLVSCGAVVLSLIITMWALFVSYAAVAAALLISAIAIKVSSPGPIIFTQERVGLRNRTFKMYKFRSMEMQKPSAEAKGWTRPNDPRVTGIGKVLRHTSMDELPQLFNILKGDMSIVGPRPERPQFVEKFKEEIPRYMIKHQVRPGLTGWAQVNGLRGDTSITKRVEYDLFYIENWTMSFDIKIMILTVFKGLINKNAY